MRSLAENQDVAGLHKMPTGVEGFDAITSGGLPRNRTFFILGGPRGGKTVFALQTLVMGRVISAIRISSSPSKRTPSTFWQTPQASGGTSLNWKEATLLFDAKMGPDVIKAAEFDLSGMLAGIKAEADARGARRIVFDAVDALLSLLDDPLAERREIYRLGEWLPRAA